MIEHLIRPATLSDATACHQFQSTTLPETWSTERWEQEITSKQYQTLLAEADHIIGLIHWQHVTDEAEIHTIGVAEAYRKRGIASALITHAIQQMRQQNITQIHLEVRSSNLAAQALYQSHDFTHSGTRKGYYKSTNGPEDAVLMGKKL